MHFHTGKAHDFADDRSTARRSRPSPARWRFFAVSGVTLVGFATVVAALITGCTADVEPMTDADCQNTYWCTDKGRCKADGDNCVASSEADCEASSECKSAGKCELRGGACHTQITDPCVGKPPCTQNGYCVSDSKSRCCNASTGWCCDSAGNCANK